FNRAIQVAFERLIPPGEQVPYFIYFEVPAETIDVNIHPTKTEIKFESEQAVWQILMAAVKEAVGRFNDVPAIDFNNEGRPDIPIFNPDTHTSAPKINLNPDYNPFRETPHKRNLENWETIYPQITAEEPTLFENNEQENSIIEEKSPAHYQYKGKYIMTAVKSGLMIIDQHQAHIRILYEDYMRQIESKKRNTQKLLFPEIIQLPTKTNQFAETILPELNEMGFELTDIGDGSYAVNGTPSGLEGLNIANLLAEMLVSVNEITSNTRTDIDHTLALSLARNAAIPYGQVLGNQEMENIVNSLFACENVNYTPDGQKIISIMSQSDIDSLFDK
ncbi:MAG: DNA mismatch repair protein MutL, partial [Prevotella micans]|nr:DNA mismatch repair protein MutL [Prevotella micans]